jgi:hypothetical protein
MATAADYARWIVENKDKRGTPEFETVARAYQVARDAEQATPQQPEEQPRRGTLSEVGRQVGLTVRHGIEGIANTVARS